MSDTSYWHRYASTYLAEWKKNKSRIILNTLESEYVSKYIHFEKQKKTHKLTYIDIGCGPGRIVDFILSSDRMYKEIICLDNNRTMIHACEKRFLSFPGIRFFVRDIRDTDISSLPRADIVTGIRILKYVKERTEIFRKIVSILHKDGIFIFTITNRQSIAYFDTLGVKSYKDTFSNIRTILANTGFRLLEVRGFQRFPEVFYTFASLTGVTKFLFAGEKMLSSILGDTVFTRTLYITAQKI